METGQLLLTEDDIAEARRMFGWRFWYDAAFWSALTLGLFVACIVAGDGNRIVFLLLLILFGTLASVNVIPRVREYHRFRQDMVTNLAEVILAAPNRVRRPNNFFCYMQINGRRVRVPWDRYFELRDANLVKIVLLPTCRVAVRVEVAQGLGIRL